MTMIDGDDFYDEGYDDDDRSLTDCKRICFIQNKFYGREKELLRLHSLYDTLCDEGDHTKAFLSNEDTRRDATEQYGVLKSSSVVAIISGYSGTGKSSLVEKFIEELGNRSQNQATSSFFYMSGKYDELNSSDPFSAIIQAFNGLFISISQECDGETLDQIRESIKATLASEVFEISAIIPEIIEILGLSGDDTLSLEASTNTSWHRLLFSFKKLLKVFCEGERPLIMFLDDLQFADSTSMDLLLALLEDTSVRNLFFIGAVRSDDIDSSLDIQTLIDKTERIRGRKTERLDLMNLTMRDICNFVGDTLSLETEECQPLANFVYDKTRGNIFYAMQTLEELQRLNFLHFSVISFRWEWNLEGVGFHDGLSENLQDAVVGKIQHAPQNLQRALILASFVRSIFDVQTLLAIVLADGWNISSGEMVQLLDIAVLEGFLRNSIGSQTYRFAHDRIQQSAYSLTVAGPERDNLRLLVGTKLFELAEREEGEDWMFFVAANHLNTCSIDFDDYLRLSKLNFLCGERANAVAAFVPASMYLRIALNLLRKLGNNWTCDHLLSLKIYQMLCEIELCLGNIETGDELAKEVIKNAQCFDDKLPTLLSLAVAKGRLDQHAESYHICKRTLLDLKAIPRHYQSLHIFLDSRTIKRQLRQQSDCEILLFPILKDEKKKLILEFLAEGQLRAYYCGNMVDCIFCCLKSLRMTFKYGISAAGAQCFAVYGLYLDNICGDYSGALRMARLARKILERVKVGEGKAQVALAFTTIVYNIEAWTSSRDHILSSGHLAHRAGMESGDVDLGFLNWIIANYFAYSTGYPLSPVEETGREILHQLELYSANSIMPIFVQMRLPLLYFLGIEDETPEWGKLEYFETACEGRPHKYHAIFGYLGRLELALFYGDLELASRMSIALQPHLCHESSYAIITKNLFYTCLTYSGLSRRRNEMGRRNRSKAKTIAKEMSKLCRRKGLNCRHKKLIMKADILAGQSSDLNKVVSAYDKGIGAAVKLGYVQDAALASEIAGAFFLSILDLNRAGQYICQAHDLYKEWGAVAKATSIASHYPEYVDR